MNVGKFNERRFYSGLRLNYRLRLWAPTSASYAISVVAELLFNFLTQHLYNPFIMSVY